MTARTAEGGIRFARTGGPEVLAWEAYDDAGTPGDNEVRIRQTAIGLNFIDTYHRSGLYPVPLPSGIGLEAAGEIEAVGEGVEHLRAGDRVGYCWGPIGAYATHRTIGADMVVKLPNGVSDEVAAAAMLKGLTAEFLIERCAKVQPGWTVLLHAAAGGVGLIAAQWLAAIGATVIGTVGSGAKAELARTHGCAHVLRRDADDIAARVREITGGAGVPVVLDGVGAATFEASLACLARRGLLVSYGNASGAVPPFELGRLARMGSQFVTRPTLFDYYATRSEKEAGAVRLFGLIADGSIKIRIDQTYPLQDAARAHIDLEASRTTGSTVLIP